MNEEPRHAVPPELLERVAQGDERAFSEVYDILCTPIYSLALQILREPSDAEDLVQEVFLKIWRQAASYNAERGTPYAWAATLTRYRAIDRLRSRSRRTRLHEAAQADSPEIFGTQQDDFSDRSDAEALRGACGRLPAEQRDAIHLAFFRGLTQPEIAAHLQEPLGTVKARIRRGMLKLREYLSRQV